MRSGSGRIHLPLVLVLVLVLEGLAAAEPRILILRSRDLPAYTAPARTFRDELGARFVIDEDDMAGDRARGEALVRALPAETRLIFAVGAQAAVVAAAQDRVPVVFTSVLNWGSYRKRLARPNVAGVALEVPADAQLTQIKFLSPELRRLVVITRSRRADPRLFELIEAGRRLHLEIVQLPLAEAGALRARRNRERIETAVYPLADPAVYTGDAFLELVALTRQSRQPLIAYSEKFVEAGATMAVGVSYADLGAQAALIAGQILDGTSPAELGVAPPVGTSIALNQAAAAAVGLELGDELRRMSDRVYTRIGEPGPAEPGAPRLPDDDAHAAEGDADPFAAEHGEADFFTVEDEIVKVAAGRRQRLSEAPSTVSVWTREDLEALGARTLADALMLLPGVTARYTKLGAWDVVFRGQHQPADLLVLIDGQRINSMYDGTALYDLPAAAIARIEVIRGPGSALYGTHALAGVISVITRGERSPRAWAAALTSVPAGDAVAWGGTAHARDDVRLGGWELGLSATLMGSQAPRLRMPVDVTGALDPPRYLDDHKRSGALFAYLGRRDLFGGRGSLELAPKLVDHRHGPNFGPTETLAPDSSLARTILVVPLEVGVPLGAHATLRARLSYDRQWIDEDLQIRSDGFRDRANPVPAPDGLRNRTSYGVNNLALEPQAALELGRTPVWDRHVLTVGVLAERGWIDGFHYDQNYLDQDGTLQYYANFSPARKAELEERGVPTSGFQNYNAFTLAQKDADRLVLSAYAQSELRLPRLPIGDLWLTLGLRVDRFSDFRSSGERKTYTAVDPRGALVWAPASFIGVKLMYGRAFRAPSFQELYDPTKKVSEQFSQIPNEALAPETVSVTELGLELRPAAWLVARGSLFQMTTDKNLDFDPTFNPVGVQVINFPGREARGVELELALRPTPHDFLIANFAELRAEQLGTCVRPEPDGSCTGDANIISKDITDIPRRRWNLAASLRPLGLPVELSGAGRGPAYRALGPLALAVVYEHVGASRNNARVTFEQLNFPFVHPGWDRVDVGLTYPFRALGGTLSAQVFVYNVLDADVAEPLILTLEPRPAEGYFLPRPGRSFMTRLELRY